MACTLGLWALIRRVKAKRYGLWQCDECGSTNVVAARRVKRDANGRSVGRSHRRAGAAEEEADPAPHAPRGVRRRKRRVRVSKAKMRV